jgi:hypothetical protein
MSRRDDRGQIAGIEALPFGVLVFVVGSLLVANAWAVIDAKLAVAAAAREAARTYVEAVSDDPAAATSAAVAAARDAVAGYGRDPNRLELTIEPGTAVARCRRIVVHAAYVVPAVTLPWIGGFGSGITANARNSELVDPFRDGVAGTARCA